jgi:2-polyprenyl-3-methyl-5-hydroxy-6-metoxy-1,4-benzoquinol methylase
MLRSVKQYILHQLRRRGIKLSSIPKDQYVINANIGLVDRAEVRRIAREETLKDANVRPTWEIADHYLDLRRFSYYCDVVEILGEMDVPMEGRRVLEVGSCFGVTLYLLHRRFPTAKLYGIEPLEKALRVGRRVCPQAEMRSDTLGALTFEPPFDLVIMTEVLEHMVDPAASLDELYNITAPGGWIFVAVPNGRLDNSEADEFVPANQSYRGHINFWSPESWKYFLERTFPNCEVRTGHMPHWHIFQLFALIGKPSTEST